MVLFNGMERTTPYAALYFVALMTFGNYVLFNLLVAILVEGFSQEVRGKRRTGKSDRERGGGSKCLKVFFISTKKKQACAVSAHAGHTVTLISLSLSPPFLTFHWLTFYFFFSFSFSSSQDERKASVSDEEEKAEEVKQERLIYFYGPNDDLERGRCTAAAFNDSGYGGGKLGGKTFCFLFFLSCPVYLLLVW